MDQAEPFRNVQFANKLLDQVRDTLFGYEAIPNAEVALFGGQMLVSDRGQPGRKISVSCTFDGVDWAVGLVLALYDTRVGLVHRCYSTFWEMNAINLNGTMKDRVPANLDVLDADRPHLSYPAIAAEIVNYAEAWGVELDVNV